MLTVVHVTHEAVQKIGGIGAVLDGLVTAGAYRERVGRTILVGPLFSRRGGIESRLGPRGRVLYSSIDGVTDHPCAAAFRAVQADYGVEIVYGQRPLYGPADGREEMVDVLLVDVHHVNHVALNVVKYRLFEEYGIASDRFEGIWEYEQYVRLAGPAVAALRGMGVGDPCVVVAHEFMGMPTALLAMIEPGVHFRSLFYAHETATVRRIVEDHPGHDVTFYNIMRRGRQAGRIISDYFGSQHGYFKHALVEAARACDGILAVGPEVVEELKFLAPEFSKADINLTYNGIPSRSLTLDEVTASKRKLQQYCHNLLGWTPDFVFTHVTRLVRSKGLWRDLWVLDGVEEWLGSENRTAVLLVLSTETGGPRRHDEILRMERAYRWPVAHREGYPDLTHGEAEFHAMVQEFNARNRCCRAIFINQFGFDRESCGERMPPDVEFWDIRRGSDAEFGQSVYEPFGIAQLEALAFGALCVMSSVCGCVGYVKAAAGSAQPPNVIIPDYTALPESDMDDQSLLSLTAERRERLERAVARQVASQFVRMLPRTPAEKEARLKAGIELAARMSWDRVAADYFLPALEKALRHIPRG